MTSFASDADALDQLSVDTIRTLAIDAIQRANSGHPGTPMGMAPAVYALWQRVLRFDPEDPIWPNRDRFILSCGHASMLLYSLLYLTRTRAVDPAHGEPLGAEEVRLTKDAYGWPPDAAFLVPDGVRERFTEGVGKRGAQLREDWEALFNAYCRQYPGLGEEIEQIGRRDLPDEWHRELPTFPPDAKGVAGRDASAKVLNAVARGVPWLMGGSADSTPSTKTRLTLDGAGDFQAGAEGGRNLHFGVREHAMGAILNGLALVKLRPFGSGFLIFSDYARGAIRLSALMELPVIHIFTHDSIGVGEDGPTHQPVEQLISLRAIPNLIVLRPADANEVVESWRVIMTTRRHPVALILTRQPLPTLDRTRFGAAAGVAAGAYVLLDPVDGPPDVLLMASGSEVALCVSAAEALAVEGIRVRVVSMPSWELFEWQTQEYRDSVLPPAVTARVAVEQASTLGWSHYAGESGAVLGMKTFGMSAPLAVLQQEFGFTPEHVALLARAQIARARAGRDELRRQATAR